METMQILLNLPKWNIEALNGYQPKTTFWQDFSIADCYGVKAVKDTFRRAFIEWQNDYIYLTELVLVLNHKIWQHYEHNNELAATYNELWRSADEYACEHLKGDELTYYFEILD